MNQRISSIDAMRGLVIVLMALDHCRDFFGDMRILTEDPATTTVALFFTRWITHFCAPAFVFLAGISAWLHGEKLGNRRQLAGYLLTRGFWLLILDHTVVYFALALSITIVPWMFIVLSAIGCSMVALSVLCFLPTRAVLVIGLIIICGHNLLDGVDASMFGRFDWIWILVHDGPGYIEWANLEVGYPVLAWVGVMATGYGFAPLLKQPPFDRSRFLLVIGTVVVVGFFILRMTNAYGDPRPWSLQGTLALGSTEAMDATSSSAITTDWVRTGISFLRATKYPPSLIYLLMTLGPALMLLGWFEHLGKDSSLVQHLEVFGRVPLFFYVLHFYLIHIASIFTYWVIRGVPLSPFQAIYSQSEETPLSSEFGFPGLWQVYVAWCVVIVLMYPLCKWFGRVKRNGKSALWSYL
ncbi:MAG: DUF1624 domain-containing protein [Planctomycetales bacterium]|nr:DUF1624 domain-containing protein [Planctomycetales bacterium]